ncbi:acrylyl-CoA reductase (NADPH) [Oryzibacter oryziterrae]|uniref:acrylyl-CoA reductase (NADPH) n=1 Tax=Oryzibacter oryziterrae TaxID=2766474 RepID=UPI001F1901C2|nr:MDR family oxidoreductase [Oryzibacter oryziterrae]
MNPFKAVVVERDEEKRQSVSLRTLTEADLMEGDVTLRVSHSSVNYKDGLAVTGKLPVVRRWPMVPGVDVSAEVISSADPLFKPGDQVILNGWGVGEAHLGGWSEIMRVKGDWLIKRPAELSAYDCAAIGTAGYTAMLSLMAIESYGLKPADGAAVVTGAAGGVGSISLMLLKNAGWHVIATTGKLSEADHLRHLGAEEVIDRAELSGPAKPLAKERWVTGIDNVGSHTLANVLSMTKGEGAIVACGNAQGMDLPSSVAPFILRGVALIGINSVTVPRAKREIAWARLAKEIDLAKLHLNTRKVSLDGAIEAGRAIAEGKIKGRVVVEVQ